MSHSNNNVYDVVIIGGGLVGNSLALALANDARVAVVESQAVDAIPSPDPRPLTLSYASQRILQALQLWDDIKPHATPITHIDVSCQGHYSRTQFNAADYQVEALGQVVVAQQLTAILRERVLQHPQLTRFYSSTLEQLTAAPGAQHLQLQTPQGTCQLEAKLLVAADGANSHTRELLGIGVRHEDHGQSALAAVVQLARSHRHVAYERFIGEEILAALPYGEQQVGVVWAMPAAQAAVLKELPEIDFCQRLQTAFGYQLGKLLGVNPRQLYPLRGLQAVEQVRPHAVLLGNAAHTLYPVAAQGFNLSLRDVAVLAQVVKDAMAAQKNPGDFSLLTEYARWREGQQLRTISMTRAVSRLFEGRSALAKELSLLALTATPSAKNQLAQQALGVADICPRWVLSN
jgi:2-octaprenyl-6-methoxyphenol hydroxylase